MGVTRQEELLGLLKERFEKNLQRHEGVEWASVLTRLKEREPCVRSLIAMEVTGGEPDVIDHDERTGEYVYCDCSPETPSGRRNLCYDRQAREFRKKHKPLGSAVEAATAMGIKLLSEDEYRHLQQRGEFDLTTSSWIATPDPIRNLGGALFCDRRFDHVFVYHNGAESYYAARGFRGLLRV